MKTLEKGQDKLKHICEILKNETLEPAKQEAENMIKAAEARAEQILAEAKQQAKKIIEEGRYAVEQERSVFESSLAQSAKQSIESLKQLIEQKLFNDKIDQFVIEGTSPPQVVTKLIEAIVKGLEKEGHSNDLAAIIPQSCSPEEIARSLTLDVAKQLENHTITIGSFAGGAQIKLVDKKIKLVITDKEIAEFLKQYVRKDFRKFLFGSPEGQK